MNAGLSAYELPPAIEVLRGVVRDFANAELRPRVGEFESNRTIPQEVVERMGQLGLFAAPFAESEGGAGAGETARRHSRQD